MTAPRHRLADRLLLVTNLVVANVAAAVYVVVFLQPGFLLGAGATPFAAVTSGARVALLPLSTALAWPIITICSPVVWVVVCGGAMNGTARPISSRRPPNAAIAAWARSS